LSICICVNQQLHANKGRGRGAYFSYPCPQERPNKELKPLKLRLYDNKAEVCLRIHVPRLRLHELNLGHLAHNAQTNASSKLRQFLTCRLILSIILAINVSGHGSSSGATRSATHARVSSWRSRVSWGIESPSISAKMSSMSIGKLERHRAAQGEQTKSQRTTCVV